jgi:hypothetical protein
VQSDNEIPGLLRGEPNVIFHKQLHVFSTLR